MEASKTLGRPLPLHTAHMHQKKKQGEIITFCRHLEAQAFYAAYMWQLWESAIENMAAVPACQQR